MKLNGAEILIECFKEQEINTIFGYPGGAVISFYDTLYDQQDTLTHIRTAHEQSAIHAADSYARVTGKVGVAIVTSGPGATNTITGIANAYMDSVPLVVFTGQVTSNLLGRDSFQEIDITGVTISITKHNYFVNDVKKLAETVREAFRVANTGRKGPVLVDITKDVFTAITDFKPKEVKDTLLVNKLFQNTDLLKKVAELINNSQRPLICAGGGVKSAKASKELIKIAELTDIPVVNTLMGLGTIPRNHKLSLGLAGMHGLQEANIAITKSDVLLVLGSRFSDRFIGNSNEFANNSKVIHIDIDKTEIGKNYKSYLSVNLDIKEAIAELAKYLQEKDRSSWYQEIKGFKLENNHYAFHPKNILGLISKEFSENVNLVTDVGQHQMWTAQCWNFNQENSFITSGGLGTMGFGLGASIGSQVASSKRTILITGDGSFNMTCNELFTITKYKLPVIIIIMNNNALGMVRQWQKMFYSERLSETTNGNDVDYVKLANAYGIAGYRVTQLKELKKVIKIIKTNNKPVLVECIVNKDENVYPMIPPGKSMANMITE